jgi:hypothetical protein
MTLVNGRSPGRMLMIDRSGTAQRAGERNVAGQPNGDNKVQNGAEEGGPRFKTGSEDLDQLEGIEKQQDRSRKARREHEQQDAAEDATPEELGPLIDDIEKSRRRVKNRFKGIKNYGDAIDEFGS